MLILLSALAMAAPLVEVEDTAVRTLVSRVSVLGPDGRSAGLQDVILAEGRIEQVLPAGEGWSVPVARNIDGTGKTLMPGLVDAHIHVESTYAIPGTLRVPSPRDNLNQFLYWGVTTALDLSASRKVTDRANRWTRSGKVAGPTLFTSGKPFGAPGGHPRASLRAMYPGPLAAMFSRGMAHEVADSDDVDAGFVKEGVSGFVKVAIDSMPPGAPSIDDAALDRIRLGATALGDTLIAHVGRPEDLDRALALPADALAHMPWSGGLAEGQAEQLAEKRIPVVATLVVWEAAGRVYEGRPFDTPMERASLGRRQRRDLERAAAGQVPSRGPLVDWAATLEPNRAAREKSVRELFDLGGRVLVGTDSPMVGLAAGASIHHELEALHRAGLPISDVLSAATWENARFVDPDGKFGAVRTGWEADLLLVDGDPTVDLASLRAIEMIWTDGRQVTRRGAPAN